MIRRWLNYRVKKLYQLHSFTRTSNPTKHPYTVLMGKLSGLHAPPKARQGYQQFMKEHYQERIDPFVKKAWAEHVRKEHIPADELPGPDFRAKITRDLFKKLPESERLQYSMTAKGEAFRARTEYENELNGTISLEPHAMQR